MQTIKGRGLERELRPLMKRVSRAYALGRISEVDHHYVRLRLEECEARIIAMTEYNNSGEEVCEPDGSQEAVTDPEDITDQ